MEYVKTLVNAGLDHVQITLESHLPEIHDELVNCHGAWKQTTAGIQNVLQTRLFVMTNTTLLEPNCQYLDGLLSYLSDLGVPTIGLNSLIYSGKGANVNNGLKETDLEIYLSKAKDHVQKTGQKLIWYTPTQYCHFDPVTQELGIKGCSAARYNMCIEPDGSVLPCQSYYVSLGNILKMVGIPSGIIPCRYHYERGRMSHQNAPIVPCYGMRWRLPFTVQEK